MRTNLSRRVFVLCVVAPIGVALADDTFRCGNRLIEPGLTRTEVLALCGEPTSKSFEVQDVCPGVRPGHAEGDRVRAVGTEALAAQFERHHGRDVVGKADRQARMPYALFTIIYIMRTYFIRAK
jgi:hypothetical protein